VQSGSLQGFGSFTPSSVLSVETAVSDGGTDPDEIEVGLFETMPTTTCSTLVDGFPLNGTFEGEVAIYARQTGPLTPGTYPVVDFTTFGGEAVPEGGLAAVLVGLPTDPMSAMVGHLTGAVPDAGGTVTLTSVGPVWAGSFSTLVFSPTGQSALSGTFETSATCVLRP
jgi:hypothetical protein